MNERRQRTANRSAGLAIGLMFIFFVVAAVGNWEGLIGLALGLLLYFIALAHVPLGIVAVVAAFRTGQHVRNSWIYVYFGGFLIAAGLYLGAVGEWDAVIADRIERITDRPTVGLRDALQRFNSDRDGALREIEAGADVHTRDRFGRTPLMLAASAGFGDVVERLLDAGADPHAVSNDGANVLHYAAAGGMFRHSNPSTFNINLAVVTRLLQANVDVNTATSDGTTPLIGACVAGSIEVVSALLDAGADVGATPQHGRDCLRSAVRGRQTAFVRWLLTQSGASADAGSALGTALYARDPDMFALLLNLGADPAGLISPGQRLSLALRLVDDDPEKAVMRAALIASGQSRRAFAQGGAQELRDVTGGSGDPEKIRNLLALGVDPNASDDSGFTALHSLARFATGSSGIEKARVLIEAGANVEAVDRSGTTPLGIAAGNGRLEMLEFLIANGADVNATDTRGVNVLMRAAREGYGYIIEALGAAGVDRPPPPAQIEYFRATKNHAPGMRALIAIGLDPNHPDEHGYLPLFSVIKYGNVDTLAAMIESGAKLDLFEDGYSPLTAAVDQSKDAAVELLLDAGTNPAAPDRKRRTPLDIALRKRSIPTTIALIRHGATVTELQRRQIEERLLSDSYKGRRAARKAELRALL